MPSIVRSLDIVLRGQRLTTRYPCNRTYETKKWYLGPERPESPADKLLCLGNTEADW